ncbi:MAG: radical SAM protein [Acidobacteriota bacterium]
MNPVSQNSLNEPKISFRIIRRCNFRCPFCSTFSSPDRKGIMRLEDFKAAVEILSREGFCGILNLSGGETTLHPSLAEMVSLVSKKLPQGKIVVFTNGDWIGQRGWRNKLEQLLEEPNVFIRFSLDRQHAKGRARALALAPTEDTIRDIEMERLTKAASFIRACAKAKGQLGRHYDFAYKGSLGEAKTYLKSLGKVPIYPIRFQKDPRRRAKKLGFFAVDVQEDDRVLVFLTLGHVSAGEALGGIEALPLALRINRQALQVKPQAFPPGP